LLLKVAPADIKRKIQEEFRRVEDGSIGVEANGGQASLNDKMRSLAARTETEGAA
jgi:hypothetical protein